MFGDDLRVQIDASPRRVNLLVLVLALGALILVHPGGSVVNGQPLAPQTVAVSVGASADAPVADDSAAEPASGQTRTAILREAGEAVLGSEAAPGVGGETLVAGGPTDAESMTPDAPVEARSAAPADAVTAEASRPTRVMLATVGQVWQTYNNCGPASVSMILDYYDYNVSQAEAEAALRASPEDAGMIPGVVPAYVARFGLQARVLDHGTIDDIRALLSYGAPVIVAQWLTDDEAVAHYRVVVGYDDAEEVFYVNDGVLGFNQPISYAEFETLWDLYDNLYIPVFHTDATSTIQSLLGEGWERVVTYVAAVKSETVEASQASQGAAAPLALTDSSALPTTDSAVSAADETAVTPGATRQPNVSADAAWTLNRGATQSGVLSGASTGGYAFYTVTVTPQESGAVHLQYTPDDGVISQGVGVKVYGANGQAVGTAVNTTGRVGEKTVALPTAPGVYLIQVYNYMPTVAVTFGLTWE